MAPAGDARHRLDFLRAGHGADAQPAGRLPTASACRPRRIPSPCSAPQATLMASVANGMFGGELPWSMVAIGAWHRRRHHHLDEILRARGSTFRTPVLAVAVGIYLPLETMVPIFLGGLLNYLVTRTLRQGTLGRTKPRSAIASGMLFAAGLITGEALMGILMAIPIVVAERRRCAGAARRHAAGRLDRRSWRAWRCSPASPSGCTGSAHANRPEPGSGDGLTSVPIPCPRTPPIARS